MPHYIGNQPNKNGIEKKDLMLVAGVIIIEEREGSIYLDRYNLNGEWGRNF